MYKALITPSPHDYVGLPQVLWFSFTAQGYVD